METLQANGIEIAYETFGNRSARPLILIMGLATQMVAWPEAFCRQLAEAGHWVVRFDNRDVGLSSKLEDLGTPDLDRLGEDLAQGRPAQVPYTLSDMAADTIGLMDALELKRAHVCGLSMGGMIAQQMALEHPRRVTSLISLMSTTSERDLPPSTPEAQKAMMSTPPNERQAFIDYRDGLYRTFVDHSSLFDADLQRELSGQAFDRGLYPWGFVRQMAAIKVAQGRRQALKSVQTPTLVIHGTHDAVLPLEHGSDTANAIPNAKLMIVEGMGHCLAFPTLWESLVKAIAEHTAAAE